MAHRWSKVTVFCEGWAARQQPQPEPDRASSPCAASPAHPANGDQQSQRCGYPLPTEVFASKNLKRSSHNRYHHLLKTFWNGANGWRDRQLPDGTVVWTSPTGHTYTTHPGSRHPRRRTHQPPAVPGGLLVTFAAATAKRSKWQLHRKVLPRRAIPPTMARGFAVRENALESCQRIRQKGEDCDGNRHPKGL